jgi:hypothetical protein
MVAGGVATGMDDPVAGMTAFFCEHDMIIGILVKIDAEFDQTLDCLVGIVHKRPDRFRIIQMGSGFQGVVIMALVEDGIGVHLDGDAALCEHRIGVHERFLRQNQNIISGIDIKRCQQAGQTGADDQNITGLIQLTHLQHFLQTFECFDSDIFRNRDFIGFVF